MRWAWLPFFILLHITASKVTSGSLYSDSDWVYLEKFCFDESGGLLQAEFTVPPEQPGQRLVLYADMEYEWPTVYGSSNDCQWKVTGNRPRWWYVVVSNCRQDYNKSVPRISIPWYNLTFTNKGSRVWAKHFSKDEQGMYEMCIWNIVVDSVLLWLLAYSKRVAKRKGLQYQVTKMTSASVAFTLISHYALLMFMIPFSYEGESNDGWKAANFFFEALGEMTVLFIILLIGRGYTISTNNVMGKRSALLIVFVFLLLYVLVYVWSVYVTYPAAVLYIYQSLPGYVLLALRVFTFIWFLCNVYDTWKAEPDRRKKVFYGGFGTFAMCWFLNLPFMALVALSIPSWARAKIVYGVQTNLTSVLYMVLIRLFWPTKQNTLVLNPLQSRALRGHTDMLIFPELPENFTDVMALPAGSGGSSGNGHSGPGNFLRV